MTTLRYTIYFSSYAKMHFYLFYLKKLYTINFNIFSLSYFFNSFNYNSSSLNYKLNCLFLNKKYKNITILRSPHIFSKAKEKFKFFVNRLLISVKLLFCHNLFLNFVFLSLTEPIVLYLSSYALKLNYISTRFLRI